MEDIDNDNGDNGNDKEDNDKEVWYREERLWLWSLLNESDESDNDIDNGKFVIR